MGFLPAGSDDNDYDVMTSTAVAKFQQTRWLTVDGVYGMTSDGFLFPRGILQGVDYSWARPGGAFLASRGVKLAGRYLWDTQNNKGISLAEYDDLKGNGIDPFFFFETSHTDSMALGYAKGVEHATRAVGFIEKYGLPSLPIYFNVDHDAAASQLPAIIEGCRGAASIVGLARVGLYGEYDVLKAAFDAGVITYGCQTYAWSNGKWEQRAQVQQWSNGHNWNGAVDFTRAMHPNFGQRAV